MVDPTLEEVQSHVNDLFGRAPRSRQMARWFKSRKTLRIISLSWSLLVLIVSMVNLVYIAKDGKVDSSHMVNRTALDVRLNTSCELLSGVRTEEDQEVLEWSLGGYDTENRRYCLARSALRYNQKQCERLCRGQGGSLVKIESKNKYKEFKQWIYELFPNVVSGSSTTDASIKSFGFVGLYQEKYWKAYDKGRAGTVSRSCGWTWTQGNGYSLNAIQAHWKHEVSSRNEHAKGKCIQYVEECNNGESSTSCDNLRHFVMADCQESPCLCEYPARAADTYFDWDGIQASGRTAPIFVLLHIFLLPFLLGLRFYQHLPPCISPALAKVCTVFGLVFDHLASRSSSTTTATRHSFDIHSIVVVKRQQTRMTQHKQATENKLNKLTPGQKRELGYRQQFLCYLPALLLFNAAVMMRPFFTQCRSQFFLSMYFTVAFTFNLAACEMLIARFAEEHGYFYFWKWGDDMLFLFCFMLCFILPGVIGFAVIASAYSSYEILNFDQFVSILAMYWVFMLIIELVIGCMKSSDKSLLADSKDKRMLAQIADCLGLKSFSLAHITDLIADQIASMTQKRKASSFIASQKKQASKVRVQGQQVCVQEAKKTEFTLPKDRAEMQLARDMFQCYENRMDQRHLETYNHALNRESFGLMRLGRAGGTHKKQAGLTHQEAIALQKLHKVCGAYLEMEMEWAKNNISELCAVYRQVLGSHKAFYHGTHRLLKTDPTYKKAVGQLEFEANRTTTKVRILPIAQPVSGSLHLIDLYSSAYTVRRRYNDFGKNLAAKCGATFQGAPLKGLWRVCEKMSMRPDGYEDTAGKQLFDVVRGMVLFDEWTSLAQAVQLLSECDHGRGSNVGIQESIDIIRIKNRFNHPTSGGWADALINFRFLPSPPRSSASSRNLHSKSSAAHNNNNAPTAAPTHYEIHHICEIQIVHKMLNQVRKTWGAHASYSNFRTAVQLLEAVGESDTIIKMDEEMRIQEEKSNREAIVANQDNDEDEYVAPIAVAAQVPATEPSESKRFSTREDSIRTLKETVATFNEALNELKSKFDSEVGRLKREVSGLRRAALPHPEKIVPCSPDNY